MQDVIFDVSHHQGAVDFAAAEASGMQGVIVKCTQGLTTVDSHWSANSDEVSATDLLLGAYHFGTGDDGAAQAAHFLAQKPWGLLVLDYEANVGNQMVLTGAQAFIQRIVAETGIWPVVYCDRSHAMELALDEQIVANCPLWLAQYRDITKVPAPPSGWTEIALWQHSETGTIAGVTGPCDRTAFLLDEDLATWWKEHSL